MTVGFILSCQLWWLWGCRLILMLAKVHISYMNSSYGKISTFLLFQLTFMVPLTVASHQCHGGLMSPLDDHVAGKAGYYILKGKHTNKIRTLQCVSFKNDNIMHFSESELTAWENNRASSLLVTIVYLPSICLTPAYIKALSDTSQHRFLLLGYHIHYCSSLLSSFPRGTKTAISPSQWLRSFCACIRRRIHVNYQLGSDGKFPGEPWKRGQADSPLKIVSCFSYTWIICIHMHIYNVKT